MREVEAIPGLLALFGQFALGAAASYTANVIYDATKKYKNGKVSSGVRVWRLKDKYKSDAKEIASGKEYKLLKKMWNNNDVDYVIVGSQTGKHYYLIKALGDKSEIEKIERALKEVLDERKVSSALQEKLKSLGYEITIPKDEARKKREKKKETTETKYADLGVKQTFDYRYLIYAGFGLLAIVGLALLLRR